MPLKNKHTKRGFATVIFLFFYLAGWAQINPALLEKYILDPNNQVPAPVNQFYAIACYSPVWLQKENKKNLAVLLNAFEQSPYIGLREEDYEVKLVETLRNPSLTGMSADDSLKTEVRLTVAAIHFYGDVAYGNDKPDFGYNGISTIPAYVNIPTLLAEHLFEGRLDLLLKDVTPIFPGLKAVQNRINFLYKIIAAPGFAETYVTSNKPELLNQPLILKLYQLGIITAPADITSKEILREKIKEAQKQFNLLADGTLRSTIINELNINLSVRLKQLNNCINYYRWLSGLTKNQSVIVVNIPATNLKVYKNNKIILEMKMVVGKRSTPTPTLTSRISEVILYPYWHVPYSIATKELLPLIKRNPGYINEGNYQVLNKAGNIVDPFSVNWNKYNAKYFPFLIRQSTGCDNALGLLKLNFYSPFGVYLHDTPNKYAFSLSKRYLSHGCMRMEKPMELAHLLLKNNAVAIDSLEQKGCLRNQAPIIVKTDDQMPVIVWYNPVGEDVSGNILFYEDVYEKYVQERK